MRIAIDVMGGDNGPGVVLKGIKECLAELKNEDITCILVGPESEIRKFDFSGFEDKIEYVDSKEVFPMNQQPTRALKPGKDYTVTCAGKLVKSGMADAMLSAGNTGASVAVSLALWGKIKECKKPGIAIVLPGIKKSFVMMDMGAIVDAKPIELLQFAKMCQGFSRLLGNENPSVALLSNGEEEKKGNAITKEAYKLFKENINNFCGYVEGNEIFFPKFDVVICDGFIGNIVLKTSEGVVKLVFSLLQEELAKAKIPDDIQKAIFYKLSKKVDYSEYGGAIVLGVKGINIISHGSSGSVAIKNAIKQAYNYYSMDFVHKMESELASLKIK